MENYLQQIAANTAPKDKMTNAGNDTTTRIITHLNPPIELNREKNMKWLL